mmetsp:Transcript_93671/g.274342  ORF Transcript_93671/g.274342 Transcript_93671/m.274342 type:complete len:219 (-) Transcript_93671:2342-2998(-)
MAVLSLVVAHHGFTSLQRAGHVRHGALALGAPVLMLIAGGPVLAVPPLELCGSNDELKINAFHLPFLLLEVSQLGGGPPVHDLVHLLDLLDALLVAREHGDSKALARGCGEGDLPVGQHLNVETLREVHGHRPHVHVGRAAPPRVVQRRLAGVLLLMLLPPEDLGADLVDEEQGLRQGQPLRDVRVVLLPPLHAQLDVYLLLRRVPALFITVQDHSDD